MCSCCTCMYRLFSPTRHQRFVATANCHVPQQNRPGAVGKSPGQHASTFTLRQAITVQAGTENSPLDGGEWSASRPGLFTPNKNCQCLLNMRLGEPQRWSRQFREEKNLLPLLGIEPDYALPPTNCVCAVASLPLFAPSRASIEN